MGWIEFIPNWILPFFGMFLFTLRKWVVWSNKKDKKLKSIPQNFKAWIYDLRQEIIWGLVIALLISAGEESTLDSVREIATRILGDSWSDTLISIQVNSEKILFIVFGAAGNFITDKLISKAKSK